MDMIKKIMEEEGVTNRHKDVEKDRDKIRRGWSRLKDYPVIAGVTTMDKED